MLMDNFSLSASDNCIITIVIYYYRFKKGVIYPTLTSHVTKIMFTQILLYFVGYKFMFNTPVFQNNWVCCIIFLGIVPVKTCLIASCVVVYPCIPPAWLHPGRSVSNSWRIFMHLFRCFCKLCCKTLQILAFWKGHRLCCCQSPKGWHGQQAHGENDNLNTKVFARLRCSKGQQSVCAF